LENGGSKDDKMSGRVWQAMEASAGKIRVGETERRESKGRSEKEKKKKQKKGKTVEVKKVAEEWEILDKKEEVARSEKEANKLVPEKFHRWIKVFGKKQSERMLTRKMWDHAIDIKEGFVPRKRKVYLLSREEREEVRDFILEQLRKGYIRLSKSPQIVLVFFVGKKDGKKRMV